MGEYIDRQLAKDAIFNYICNLSMSKFPSKELCIASKRGAEGAFNELDYVPTADVVEVVRCKDCCYANENGDVCRYGVGKYTKPDKYCSDGERRDDDG